MIVVHLKVIYVQKNGEKKQRVGVCLLFITRCQVKSHKEVMFDGE